MTHINPEQCKNLASQRRGARFARLRLGMQIGAMGLLLGACYAEPVEETDDGFYDDEEFQAEDKLLAGGKLWTETQIRYCFVKSSSTLSNDFESALNSSWGALGIIRFTRVASCDNSDAKMVKVSYDYEYRNSAKAKVGMSSVMSSRSDVDVHMPTNLLSSPNSSVNRYLVRHEMGHILGFAHEHYRIEGQRDCPGDWDSDKYDEYKDGVQLTSYDGDSIMNYCGGNDLTAKDKEGFLKAYRSLGGGGTGGTTGGSTGGTTGGSTGGTTGGTTGDPSCRDSNSSCSSWARNGECTKNPGYMLTNCCASCNGGGGNGCHTVPANDSNYCTSACTCKAGEGDCDNNSQCAAGLICQERGSVDRCEAPSTGGSCNKAAVYRDNGGTGYGECQGDCDSDSDCVSGLRCMQLNTGDRVPGCTGTSSNNNDYCVVPACI